MAYINLVPIGVPKAKHETSLANAEYFIGRHGRPYEIILDGDEEAFCVIANWAETTWAFLGFSWGYGGEGPHEMSGIPLGIEYIASLPEKINKTFCSKNRE